MQRPNDETEWELKRKLEICGRVLPPLFQNLTNDVFVSTFCVNAIGHLVLLGPQKQLFCMNFLAESGVSGSRTSSRSNSLAANKLQQQQPLLWHLALDPSLTKAEQDALEQIAINATGEFVLLIAKKWIKMVEIPAFVWSTRGNPIKMPAPPIARRGLSTGSNDPATNEPQDQNTFAVWFEDETMQQVQLDGFSHNSHNSHNSSTSSNNKSARSFGGASVFAGMTTSHIQDGESLEQKISQQIRSKKPIACVAKQVSNVRTSQVGFTFSKVCHTAWHPLSDKHLVVLDDSEELLVFNLQENVSRPEQRHLLDFPQQNGATQATMSTHSTSFCFGKVANDAQIWDMFTCYLLRSNGAVYALCPLVPYETRISQSMWNRLHNEVNAQMELLKSQQPNNQQLVLQTPDKKWTVHQQHQVNGNATTSNKADAARLGQLKSQKYWLKESWASCLDDDPSTVSSSLASGEEALRCVKPHISGISPDTWPIALQGPLVVTPKSVVENKEGVGGSSATSIVCVPYSLESTRANLNSRAACCFVNPLLLRSYTSGHVELLLLDASPRPQWKGSEILHETKLEGLLLECLSLGIDDSAGKLVLQVDPSDPRLVYCFHSTGVHAINVAWVGQLVAGKAYETLPTSPVRQVFGVSPSTTMEALTTQTSNASVVGVHVFKSLSFGHLLVLRLASGSFEVVNVSTASSELMRTSKSGTTPLGSMTPTASGSSSSCTVPTWPIKPFGEVVEELLANLPPRGTRVSGKTRLDQLDEAGLEFVLERIKYLYEDVAYIDQLDQVTKDSVRLQVDLIKAQQEKAASVQQTIANAKDKLTSLSEKLDRALAVQQNLRKRTAAVLQAVKENQPALSRAEQEFKQEMLDMQVQMRRLKPRVAQLSITGARMIRQLENAALTCPPPSSSRRRPGRTTGNTSLFLSEDKKRMCFDVLRAETQLIDDTKKLLEDMSQQIKQLKL